jgi:hypothetical protein
MNRKLSVVLLSAFAALATIDAAEKQKTPDVNSYPFWTGGKKAGAVTQFVPGLNAALQLSDSQKEQIAAARDEMMNDEGVKAARGISKSDPNVTTEQREKAKAVVEAATARLREKVAAILTPEQKTLIEKINAAYAAAVEDTGIIYAEKFASPSVKADPAARQRLQEEKSQDTEEGFLHKLDAILTPPQKEAVAASAKEEEQRSAKAAGTKKPVKQ